jgi:hypothetical protein
MRHYPLHFCKPVDLAYLRRCVDDPTAFSEALASGLKINPRRERRLRLGAPLAAESTKTATASDTWSVSSAARCLAR